jgi:hypothetical protein
MTEFKASLNEYKPHARSPSTVPPRPRGRYSHRRPGGIPAEPVRAVRGERRTVRAAYGSTPARRAAATASPRVWAPSLRMAERR